jgi:hypothetical protein
VGVVLRQTVAKGVKDAGQVLRGTAAEVAGQVKDHSKDLQQLRKDMESTVTSYVDPQSMCAALSCKSVILSVNAWP